MTTPPNDYLQEQYEKVSAFRATLTPETDRGCVLMAAAFLDVELGCLLRHLFVADAKIVDELLGPSRPLATFSARIDLAFALGLLGPAVYRDLHLIRKIRNLFAHEFEPLSFSTPAVASRCNEFYSDGLKPGYSPRARFTRSALGVLAVIHARTNTTAKSVTPADPVIDDNRRGEFDKMMQGLWEALDLGPKPSDA